MTYHFKGKLIIYEHGFYNFSLGDGLSYCTNTLKEACALITALKQT